MLKQLPVRLRSLGYALRGGFLVRPLVIAVILGLCGAVLSSIEEAAPLASAWVPTTLFSSREDAQVAQVILSVIAQSIMTVVSIVFAILLMTLMLSRRALLDRDHAVQLTGAFDIGPMRTLQQDVEFGVIQIVDIGLRAISPAVNDPSTAISCIDQLTRILIRWVGRLPPEPLLYNPPHVLRVVVPWIDLEGLLNTAFEQLRDYAANDAAVSLRLPRLPHDVAVTVENEALRQRIVARGARVVEGCRGKLPPDDLTRLERRLAAMDARGSRAGATPTP